MAWQLVFDPTNRAMTPMHIKGSQLASLHLLSFICCLVNFLPLFLPSQEGSPYHIDVDTTYTAATEPFI